MIKKYVNNKKTIIKSSTSFILLAISFVKRHETGKQ